MKDVFNPADAAELLNRINNLNPASQGLWGKMKAAQMLAHCNVTYELIYDNKHPKPGGFAKLMMKLFVKNNVVSDKPYKQNGPTGPVFKITEDKNFEAEKKRLINYIKKTEELGRSYFDGKESHSFGPLSESQWNNMLYKHLDHHLKQFGV